MNKEETLELLNAIRVQINEENVSEYDLDERVNEIENLLKAIEDVKAEIKVLSEKLTNDDNYIRKIPYLYDESTIFHLEDRLAARVKEEQDNLDDIKMYQRLIENARRSIDYHNVIISIADRKLSEELEAKGPELRDMSALSEEEFKTVSETLRSKRETIDTYRENLANIMEDLSKYESRLTELLAVTEELKRAREQAELQLSLYTKEASDRHLVNNGDKMMDEMQLSSLEMILEELESRNAMLSYDHEKRLEEMINGYKEGTISHEELIERLVEFRANLHPVLVEENMVETYNDEEYHANNRAMEVLEREIAELEAKLANDDNYLVSPFIIERNNRELIRTQRNLETIDKQIASYVEENENLQEEIVVATELIEESEKEIEDYQRQIRRYGADIDPEVEKLLLSKIAGNRADILYLENTRLEASRVIEHNSIELETLMSKQERFRMVYERKQASLEKRNTVDMAARRLDELALARKQDTLIALKRRSLVSNVSIIENVNRIIETEYVEKSVEEVSHNEVSMPASYEEETPKLTPEIADDADDYEELVDLADNIAPFTYDFSADAFETQPAEEVVVNEQVVEENPVNETRTPSFDPISLGRIDVNEPVTPVVENNVEPEEIKVDFGMDPIGLGDTRAWKFKYSEKEDEALAKKAKDKAFTGKLKKFFKAMLNIIPHTLALGKKMISAGLHPVKTWKSIKNFLSRAQCEPERYLEATVEDIEREIETELNNDTVDMETVETSGLDFETSDLDADEVVFSTNDGESVTIDVSGDTEEVLEVAKVEAVPMADDEELSIEEELKRIEEMLSAIPTVDEEAVEVNVEETDLTAEDTLGSSEEVQDTVEGNLTESVIETSNEEKTIETSEGVAEENIESTQNIEETVVENTAEETSERSEEELQAEEMLANIPDGPFVNQPTVDEQEAIDFAELFLSTVADEELDIPAEAMEEEATSKFSRLSDDEIKSIISQISTDLDYDVTSEEIKEEAKKLK